MNDASSAAVRAENLHKSFVLGSNAVGALRGVDFSVAKGEFVAVMGPSGCGKSTLMNVIGLLDRPTHGDYLLHGRHVAKLRPNQRARLRRDTIGFVFQSFNLLPHLTVLENVALPLYYKGVSAGRRARLASNMIDRVGLHDRAMYYPRHLSGGQAQCAAIARALINNPSIIIADEPTGNLDSASSRLVMELLSDIYKMGNTILFVTHNPELTRYATRVVYMHDGAIIHDEQTKIGEVAATAKRIMFASPPKMTEEDDLAGVSVLMKLLSSVSGQDNAAKPQRKLSKTKRKYGKAKVRSRNGTRR